jgi:hypothetical protein
LGTLSSELRSFAQVLAVGPRVYVDANVPAGAVAVMRRDLRWDALCVMEHDELRRASDALHFARALDLGRTLITLDRDFLNPARFPVAMSPGVIVCTAADERTLVRILRHAAQHLFGPDAPLDRPLHGRVIELTVDVLRA